MAALSVRLSALTRERNELIKEADALRTRIAAAASRLESIGGASTVTTAKQLKQDGAGAVTATATATSTPGASGDADDAALRLLNKVRRWPQHVQSRFSMMLLLVVVVECFVWV